MLIYYLIIQCFSNENINYDTEILKPSILSDFITARQSRNISLNGKKEIEPIYGKFFRKPLVNLLQSIQPSVLNFRRLFFTNFDGIILKGEANCLAKFPDIMIYDCTFTEANQHPIHINGPAQREDFFDADILLGNVKE